MRTLTEFLDRVLTRTSVVIMSLLVLTVLFQIFMRYVMGSPVTFTEELSRYLLIWVGLLASAYAYRKQMHLALDILLLKLDDTGRARLNLIIHSLIFLFAFCVLFLGGIMLSHLVYVLEQTSPALGLSLGIVYLALPLSGLSICIYAIDFIMQEVGLLRRTRIQPPNPVHPESNAG